MSTDATAGSTEPEDQDFDEELTDASATSADAGFGDSAPEHPSSDTEETYPDSALQPESQGEDPLVVELGEDGEGDLAPEDL